MRAIQVVIVVAVILGIGATFLNETKVSSIANCRVIDLQQQQLVSGSGSSIKTEIRYLVITDKETFVCESSLINGKFNNSDIFWRLKKDSTYSFKVSGVGKNFLFDYRNILEVNI